MGILDGLNSDQQAAVIYQGGPLLILAGAGSGKTRVLTHRVAYMVSELQVPIEHILLLTFTNKASEEMLRRVGSLLSQDHTRLSKSRLINGGTFHSFCARVLRRFSGEAGLVPDFVIYDPADQLDAIKQAMGILGIDIKTTKPGSVLGAISNAKNELVGVHDYASYARGTFTQQVARVYLVYQQLLSKYKAVDFDDLLVKTVALLKEHPDVLENLQNTFTHILVDEYQDTNKAQYEITKLLAAKYKQLTVVGDAAQAIYSWRGADYRNLLLLKQDFPDLKILNLEQNYRSSQTILSAANQVISKNTNHPILKLWTDKGEGEKIKVYEAESEQDEARYVLQEIARGVTAGKSYSDYAILYRTNAQSRVFEEAFLHEGVPYSLFGGVRFYERKEIKDVLCYLRLLLHPEDEVSLKRAEKLGKTRLQRFLSAQVGFRERDTLLVLDEVIRVTGYLDQFDESDEEDQARLENIKELRSVAAQFPALPDFLENISLTEREARRRDATTPGALGAVTLMTLHAAKGLEFPIVFLVGMEEGLFPHSRTLMNPDEMEEERRLAYVGITRAMESLYLTYAVRRLFFGQRSTNLVSRFLADIPEDLFETTKAPLSFNRTNYGRTSVGTDWGFDEFGNWKWKGE